jgi:hypothetical protein
LEKKRNTKSSKKLKFVERIKRGNFSNVTFQSHEESPPNKKAKIEIPDGLASADRSCAEFCAENVSHYYPFITFSKTLYPLLPRQWYIKLGMAAENHISRTTDDKVAFKQDNDTTCPLPSTSRNGKLSI